MQHLMIATSLLAFAGLGLIFVSYSDAAAGAATFAVLSYMIMLMLTRSAGEFAEKREDYTGFLGLARLWVQNCAGVLHAHHASAGRRFATRTGRPGGAQRCAPVGLHFRGLLA